MFGHVQANLTDLSDGDKKRYRSAYCGLCHTLGKRHGFAARLGLTYDLTFLTLLLTSLYEPDERCGECRCVVHPCKKHGYMINKYTEYASDMTIALTYYKCLDDWQDERNIFRRCYAAVLKKHHEEVRARWPEQCAVIAKELDELAKIEREQPNDPDAGARCFGRLMEGIFLYQKDYWEEHLRRLGYGLGQYIYLADAAVDLKQDIKQDTYNPLKNLSTTPEELRPTLMMVLGDASQAFEMLPLVQDVHLLRNILYSGLWIQYNRGMQKEKKVKQ